MNPRAHAHLARELIRACGGAETIKQLRLCRVSDTALYDYANPNRAQYMPADVIADLEAYCGKPIYSGTLAKYRPWKDETPGVVEATCELTEAAARLQQLARRAAADGELSPNEKMANEREIAAIEQLLARTRAANDAGAA